MPQTSVQVERRRIRDIGWHWQNLLASRVLVNSVCYEGDNGYGPAGLTRH